METEINEDGAKRREQREKGREGEIKGSSEFYRTQEL